MSPEAFDGTAYRRAVLGPLRDGDPGAVEDLFWLGGVPHDVDDDAEIEARLRATKGFLHKEQGRARQAAVAAAVLREWPRVQRGLGDAGVRMALRERRAAGGPAGVPDGREDAPAERSGARRAVPRGEDGGARGDAEAPAARRRRQVAAQLTELARLRGEPEIAEDLYAFLGLPPTATRAAVEQRLGEVAAVARRRRPDRERTLLDELVVRARELLLDEDPAAYRAALAADGDAPEADGRPGAGDPAGGMWATASVPVLLHWAPEAVAPTVLRVERRPEGDVARPLVVDLDGYRDRKVVAGRTYEYRVTPADSSEASVLVVVAGAGGRVDPLPTVTSAAVASGEVRPEGAASGEAPALPVVVGVEARRGEGDGLLLTWTWPPGVTEAWVAWGAAAPEAGGADGRKVTNTRYEIDGGAVLHGVAAGAHVAVFAGRREGSVLSWGRAAAGSRILAP